MSVIAVLATKGGAGKSTIAAQIAIAGGVRKRKPVLFDLDTSQHSNQVWSETFRSKSKFPIVRECALADLRDEIEKTHKKHDLIILDVQAGGGDDFRRAASLADIILTPVVWDSVYDIQGLVDTVMLLNEQADNSRAESIRCMNALGKAAVIINRALRERTKSWRHDIDLMLARCGAGSLPIVGMLTEDHLWKSSLRDGVGVAEIKAKPTPQPVTDIFDLYDGIVALEREREQRIKDAKSKRRRA